MAEDFIPFAPPDISDAEIDEVLDSLRSGWITTGPKVHAFEATFATAVSAPAALAVSSGTAAMHLALLAMGVGPGDVVVTTPMTFCSTIHVIEHLGATPVLVDIEPRQLNLDAARLDEHLGDHRVKAVLPVHFAGNPCDMETILDRAARVGWGVVEDAAHAFPAAAAEIVGEVRDVGVPRAACFSFYATKPLTTAEGGMLTASSDLVEAARPWALHGMTRDAWKRYDRGGGWEYDVINPGFKYNMTDLQAALGLHQLRRSEALLARRAAIAATYDEAFEALAQVETPTRDDSQQSSHHLYVLRLHLDALRLDRGELIRELAARGVGASVHFIPVHHMTYYASKYGWSDDDLPVTAREWRRTVSLPIHTRLTDADVERIIDAVNDIVARHS